MNATKDMCKHGHSLIDETNIYTRPDGRKVCRACMKARRSTPEAKELMRKYTKKWRERTGRTHNEDRLKAKISRLIEELKRLGLSGEIS